ncbi:MAG TPA: choice-of-anchor tandem repeat GloVer-containing protein, partial [Terriglobales bacterium]
MVNEKITPSKIASQRFEAYRMRVALVLITLVLVVMATPGAQAQVFKTRHSFDGADGQYLLVGVVQATDGNLYGTTYEGGANCTPNGCGTVFKIKPSGTLTTIYNFCAKSSCTDGEFPEAGLIQATNGSFYGTTYQGGANCAPDGCGTIFKISSSGTLTTVYSFCAKSGCTDGYYPEAGLIQATNGDFYGTTSQGGTTGAGTVFKITTSGTLTTLYNFCSQSGCVDGEYPEAGLVEATNGDFYGTTYSGGVNGRGTVFRITASGTLKTLYSFCPQSGCVDGDTPQAALMQASDGNLYGTTLGGGVHG